MQPKNLVLAFSAILSSLARAQSPPSGFQTITTTNMGTSSSFPTTTSPSATSSTIHLPGGLDSSYVRTTTTLPALGPTTSIDDRLPPGFKSTSTSYTTSYMENPTSTLDMEKRAMETGGVASSATTSSAINQLPGNLDSTYVKTTSTEATTTIYTTDPKRTGTVTETSTKTWYIENPTITPEKRAMVTSWVA